MPLKLKNVPKKKMTLLKMKKKHPRCALLRFVVSMHDESRAQLRAIIRHSTQHFKKIRTAGHWRTNCTYASLRSFYFYTKTQNTTIIWLNYGAWLYHNLRVTTYMYSTCTYIFFLCNAWSAPSLSLNSAQFGTLDVNSIFDKLCNWVQLHITVTSNMATCALSLFL